MINDHRPIKRRPCHISTYEYMTKALYMTLSVFMTCIYITLSDSDSALTQARSLTGLTA